MSSETKKINVLIVDDEELARKRIRKLLHGDGEIGSVSECSDGVNAVESLTNEKFDLLFLDIQMPGLNGFEVLEQLEPENIPTIIFVTAYDKYALKAFDVHAVDYLLKPFDDDRFAEALTHAKQIMKGSDEKMLRDKLLDLVSHVSTDSKVIERFVVKSAGKMYFVNAVDVVRIKADGKYIELYANEKKHLIRETMQNIEKKLDPEKFIRVHRSVIVNVDHVKEIRHFYKNEYSFLMSNGEKLNSSSTYRKNLDLILNHKTA